MQHPVLDWNDRKNAGFRWSMPAFRFSARDLVWLAILLALTTAYAVDRWRGVNRPDSAANAEAKAAANEARNQLTELDKQLSDARDAFASLYAEDSATIADLRKQISALQDELQGVSKVAKGSTRSER